LVGYTIAHCITGWEDSRMKSEERKAGKELYQQLRKLPWAQLWTEEVPRFDKASPKERSNRVAVVRAVGVVFSESGDPAHRGQVKLWLRGLLQDPSEKTRRYAMAALPKIGAGQDEESTLLAVLRTTTVEREKKFAARALEKIGGAATLESMQAEPQGVLRQTEQKIKAALARTESPSAVRMDGILSEFDALRIHLRGRRGLEGMVREEAESLIKAHGKFRIAGVGSGVVTLVPVAPFSLADLYTLRCFSTAGFLPASPTAPSVEALAEAIVSPLSRRVLRTFTDGAIRYRLNFVGKGHQRSAVRLLAGKVYALCPEILNDARDVTWTLDIYPGEKGSSVELRPNLTPDPRFQYRRQDVPAASHPQLAACMARLAGRVENEIVWDPFCGSGLELIESALLGGVRAIHGTDLRAEAIAIAQDNFAAAQVEGVQANFVRSDFRDYIKSGRLSAGVTVVITNPPLGMRVPVPNLRELIEDLFNAAATVLRPGGRLVLANPVSKAIVPPSLKLLSRQVVDFGGFDCRVEKYLKLPR
jgi:predicted RNA methylase